MRAKKRFGQNFLKDNSIVDKIIQSMPHNLKIVEIGPGLGDLTKRLLQVTDVRAYEVDDDLSVYIKEHFSDFLKNKKLELVEKDVLKAFDAGSLYECEYNLVANLPYYIATNIILRALKDENCKNITVMIQKEVALKFAAQVKQKDFSALSILANSISEINILFDVPPTAFEPQPKVTSSVIEFKKTKGYRDIFGDELGEFERFLKCAFLAPRKTLMKNLSSTYQKSSLEEIFSEYDIPLQARAHEIDTATYHNLYKTIKKVINATKKQ